MPIYGPHSVETPNADLREAADALAYMVRTFLEEAEYTVRESTETELLDALGDVETQLDRSASRREQNS